MKNQPLSEGKIHGKNPTILEGKHGNMANMVIFHQPGFSSNKRVPFPFISYLLWAHLWAAGAQLCVGVTCCDEG